MTQLESWKIIRGALRKNTGSVYNIVKYKELVFSQLFLCRMLLVVTENPFLRFRMKQTLLKYKPSISLYNVDPWWPYNDIDSRIKVVDDIIKNLEKKGKSK